MKKLNLFYTVLILMLAACGAPTLSAPTVDPYIAADQARSTAVAAQAQAEYYGSQLTATAQAPIIQMTSDAAALALNQAYWTATAQMSGTQTAVPLTATAQSWTPTVTPTPTMNATATLMAVNAMATAQFVQNDIVRDELSVDRTRKTNNLLALAPYIIGLIVLFIGMMFARVMARKLSVISIQHDARGNAHALFDVVEGVAIDTDRMTNGALSTRRKDVIKLLPQITAERQDATTSRDQMIDLRTRSAALRKLESNLTKQLPAPAEAIQESNQDGLFPLPDWNIVNGWNRQNKDEMPCGNSGKGLEYWDLRNHPHLAVFGKTRSGKSRRALRPLVTFMLASNQRVILIGKESDYQPFLSHPNAVILPVYDITERTEAEKYAQALAACVEEKNRRIRYMAQAGVSLWPFERTFVVLDELGNALLEMDSDLAELSMKKARSMVNEGGKAGMSIVFSAQRPKGFIDLTTQCGRAVFMVESDQERKYALGMNSADRMPEIPTGYFYKKFGSLQLTGAFEPNDDEIRAYLNKQAPQSLSKADWIESIALPVTQGMPKLENDTPATLTLHPAPVNKDERENEIAIQAEKIRDQWFVGMSKNRVAQLLGFKQYGGGHVQTVNDVVDYLNASTSSTSTKNEQNTPVFRPVEVV